MNVMNELALRGYEGVGVDVDEMDITDEAAVRRVIGEVRPDSVVHCGRVDGGGRRGGFRWISAGRVNVNGTENIAKDVRGTGCPHDLSQHGLCVRRTGHTALGAGRSCGCSPLNVYGQSKYEGELAVQKYTDKYYIVRIAWGVRRKRKNFIKTMLNLGKTHDSLTVVSDQIGTPHLYL